MTATAARTLTALWGNGNQHARWGDPQPGPAVPVAVASFADEEGARCGVPCCGSRLLTELSTGGEA